MQKNKKNRVLHSKKLQYLSLFIFLLLVLLIIVYKSKNDNVSCNTNNHTHYGSDIMLDASCHLRIDENYKTDIKLRGKLNEEIDKEFWNKCKGKSKFNISFFEPCNYDDFYHYVDSKILLNKLDEITNYKLVTLLKNSYEENKEKYFKGYLSVYDNRWTHVLLAAKLLRLLNESEKQFWIAHYSKKRLNESQPLFPQTWNRIWLFHGLEIKNYKDLRTYGVENMNQVCDYKPTLKEAFEQNIFKEALTTMTNKYVIIRNFCSQRLNESEKEELKLYSKKVVSCVFDNEELKSMYQNLIEN